MQWRIVEITVDGSYLAVERGFLTIHQEGIEKGRVALDDISCLLISTHRASFSAAVPHELSIRNATLIICGENYHPSAILYPAIGHHLTAKHIRTQAEVSLPLRKNLWRSIIHHKITAQAEILKSTTGTDSGLMAIRERITSGDSENVEAQAARIYWPSLFGEKFMRNRNESGINSRLNYAYAILRSAITRAIASQGISPVFGLHHKNESNPFPLADDLMEPFRPVADLVVHRITQQEIPEKLLPEEKKQLAALLTLDLPTTLGRTPLSTCAQRLSASLVTSFELKRPALDFPHSFLPTSTLSAE